jgi:hypothetical protein
MRYRKWFSCPGPQGQVTNVLKITKSVRGIWVVKLNAPSLKSSMRSVQPQEPVLDLLQLDLSKFYVSLTVHISQFTVY